MFTTSYYSNYIKRMFSDIVKNVNCGVLESIGFTVGKISK